MNSQRSVLIVDRSEENCEVLRTVLEKRGVKTLATSSTEEGAGLAHDHRPDVIVLDDDQICDCRIFSDEYGKDGDNSGPSIIFLGKARRSGSNVPPADFFTKPYHYGPLIRRIEEILENTPRKVA